MDSIIIEGGARLEGSIDISGAKNSVLPSLSACLLTDQPIRLRNVPKLTDVATMQSLLQQHGAAITPQATDILEIRANNINNFLAPYEIVRKMRASIWVLGPLLGRFGKAIVSLPGGCAIGARQVDLHIAVMQALRADIQLNAGYIEATASSRLQGAEFTFPLVSVGATINAVLAAALAKGRSIFHNCAIEPEIIDLCGLLNKMGAKIQVTDQVITIEGVDSLHGAEHRIMSDRIEAGTYMIAAAMTKGKVILNDVNYSLLESLAAKMRQAGSSIDYDDNHIRIEHIGPIKPVDITTAPYPGIATDLQAQFMSFMLLAEGASRIEETIFENRFMHVPELSRMGADIHIEHNVAIVNGVHKLKGAEVMASDLRASVSLILAGLCAQGTTTVNRIYHLDRGYQSIEQKLSRCGANIKRLKLS